MVQFELHRDVFIKGTILRRWKRNWFDLWADGRLVFYNDQQRRDMEDEIHMRVDCINIRNSATCQGACHVLRRDVFGSQSQRLIHLLNMSPPIFVLVYVSLLRAEPTGGKDARCLAPDSVQRWTGGQPVCRQRRRRSVRQHTHTHTCSHHYVSQMNRCGLFLSVVLL